MGDRFLTSEEPNNDRENEHLSVREEDIPRHLDLQSCVDYYGVAERHLSRINYIKHYASKHCASFSLLCCLNAFLEKIPLVRCLKEYNIRKNLFGDIIAGITVAIMHIPQGMAYGVLTTLPAVHGLYVSFFPVIIYMIFGTCPHLSVGTFAVISLMVAQAIEGVTQSSVSPFNTTQTFANESNSFVNNEKITIATTLALLVGLVQVIIGTIVSHFVQLHSKHGIAVVGEIKRGLPPPSLPSLNHINQLMVPAITIAAVSLSISISMAKMFSRKHGYKVSSNQELLASGLSNVISSAFQCYPNSGSLSRSVVQEGSGGKTLLIGGFSSIVLGAVIVALTPLFRSLPMTCLAAIIIVNLKGLFFQMKDFLFYFQISFLEWILWTMTFLSVVLFDVDIGLYVGICTSFIINTIRTQKPRFVTLGQVGNTEHYKNIVFFPSAHQYPQIKILRFDESLYACNAPFFKRKFYELIGIHLEQLPIIPYHQNTDNHASETVYKYVILECSPFNYIDTVGVKLLIEIFNDLRKRGIVLHLSECRFEVRHVFELMKFREKTDIHIIYVTTHDAVMAARNTLNNESVNHNSVDPPVENSV